MNKLIIIIVAVVALLLLVKRTDMTWRQSILKAVYPVLMKWNAVTGNNTKILHNEEDIQPSVSFYSLSATGIDGQPVSFSQFKNKKVLLVNTASDCGYTAQFDELERLYKKYQHTLVIIGFPANDFKEQEKHSNDEIAAFCKTNYGVTFLLMQKGQVVKGAQQQQVYQWLTTKQMNGWNSTAPSWNFCKYLVDEKGVLTDYFPNAISPLSSEITNKL